jgi:hypothetical protein
VAYYFCSSSETFHCSICSCHCLDCICLKRTQPLNGTVTLSAAKCWDGLKFTIGITEFIKQSSNFLWKIGHILWYCTELLKSASLIFWYVVYRSCNYNLKTYCTAKSGCHEHTLIVAGPNFILAPTALLLSLTATVSLCSSFLKSDKIVMS